MEPLFLQPALKDFIWGGKRLPSEYGYPAETERVAEAWVLSCHPQGCATVKNGDFAGKTLPEALAALGEEALGKNAAAFDRFPLLIKFIDACDRLSVQVHPDDDYALRVEGEYGKTEMWLVLDCEPGAKLLYGVREPLDRAAFRRHIEQNTLDEVARYVPVHKGDVFFIPSGTLHAIGAGILLAEVQQNSATTYRVSDYGRLGADGKPRPLHIEKALDVTDLTPTPLSVGGIETRTEACGRTTVLARCRYFTAERWETDGERPLGREDSFLSLLVLDGDGELTDGTSVWQVKKGDSVFVPAGCRLTLRGKNDVLCSYLENAEK